RLPYDVIQYLDAVDAVCRAAETEGRSTIPQPYSKRDLIDLIVEIMEEFANHPMGILIYKSCMDTIALLSKFKPGMGPKLETKILQLALRRTIDRGLRRQDVCSKHFTEFLNSEDAETQVEALIMAGSLERLAARCGIY
ncbi:hypothetical protein lerEdw1_010949, partial [Lerista edwardsae]